MFIKLLKRVEIIMYFLENVRMILSIRSVINHQKTSENNNAVMEAIGRPKSFRKLIIDTVANCNDKIGLILVHIFSPTELAHADFHF